MNLPFKSLALPQVLIFGSPAEFELIQGVAPPVPDPAEDPKYWIDLDILRNPTKFGNRINYDRVLALNADGSLKMVDYTLEPNLMRRAFYERHPELRTIPVIEPLQFLKSQVLTVNFRATDKRPPIPYPVRGLLPDEAFVPLFMGQPVMSSDNLGVALMVEYDKATRMFSGPATPNQKLDEILAQLQQIFQLLKEKK